MAERFSHYHFVTTCGVLFRFSSIDFLPEMGKHRGTEVTERERERERGFGVERKGLVFFIGESPRSAQSGSHAVGRRGSRRGRFIFANFLRRLEVSVFGEIAFVCGLRHSI